MHFLQRLEHSNRKEIVKITNNQEITIEHIFPQKPDPKWKEDIGTSDYNFIQRNRLHTIANLSLSFNNGSLGNKCFKDKKNMNTDNKKQGYKFSILWLNDYLKKINRWDKNRIEKRFEIIEERFLTIWKFPTI